MKKVNIHYAKTHLSELLTNLEIEGEPFIVYRYNKPVGKMIPAKDPHKKNILEPHPILSQVKILGDITKGLDPEDWPAAFE